MRNWNILGGIEWCGNYRFQTTYEELKHTPFEELTLLFSRFQTTYEELKPEFWNSIWPRLPLPDYLWGIETSIDWMVDVISSFQTTYEELKLLTRPFWNTHYKLPDYLWGIETHFSPPFWDRLSRFQTTYEELKLITNQETPPPFDRLPDYLWGIETSIDLLDSRSERRRLPDYLWGIETLRL